MIKSELAIKRDEWFKSPQGRQATNTDILHFDKYSELLNNRLEAAFLAGAIAQCEVDQDFCNKVIDGIN